MTRPAGRGEGENVRTIAVAHGRQPRGRRSMNGLYEVLDERFRACTAGDQQLELLC